MIAVTIQPNKIVSSEVKKQLSTTRDILWKKLNELLANPIVILPCSIIVKFK